MYAKVSSSLFAIPFLVMVVLTSPLLCAGKSDLVTSVPDGWELRADSSPVALFDDGAVAVAYGEGPCDPNCNSLVVQRRDAETVTTEIDGFVSAIEYSSDGQYLLVHFASEGSGGGDPVARVALVRAPVGLVEWTHDSDRLYRFAVLDNSLLAERRIGIAPTKLRKDLKILDITGELIRDVDAGRKLNGALLLDANSLLIASGHSVERIEFAQASTNSAWVTHLPEMDSEIVSLERADNATVRVNQRWYGATLLSHEGNIEYVFNVNAMEASDPTRGFDAYSKYVVSKQSQDSVMLMDGTPSGLLVTPSTGGIRPVSLSTVPPTGFKLRARIVQNGRVVFLSTDKFILRHIL